MSIKRNRTGAGRSRRSVFSSFKDFRRQFSALPLDQLTARHVETAVTFPHCPVLSHGLISLTADEEKCPASRVIDKNNFYIARKFNLNPTGFGFYLISCFFLSVENKMKYFLPVCGVRRGAGRVPQKLVYRFFLLQKHTDSLRERLKAAAGGKNSLRGSAASTQRKPEPTEVKRRRKAGRGPHLSYLSRFVLRRPPLLLSQLLPPLPPFQYGISSLRMSANM